jgi:hypothetical protein
LAPARHEKRELKYFNSFKLNIIMADKKVATKNASRANSNTPTTSDRNKDNKESKENKREERDENESVCDTIEDYSDEGYDEDDEELDEATRERRVRFRVGSNAITLISFPITMHTF